MDKKIYRTQDKYTGRVTEWERVDLEEWDRLLTCDREILFGVGDKTGSIKGIVFVGKVGRPALRLEESKKGGSK